jgi:hypothetical protein
MYVTQSAAFSLQYLLVIRRHSMIQTQGKDARLQTLGQKAVVPEYVHSITSDVSIRRAEVIASEACMEW